MKSVDVAVAIIERDLDLCEVERDLMAVDEERAPLGYRLLLLLAIIGERA